MEPREHPHHLVVTLPDTALQIAAQLLVSLQGQPAEEKLPFRVADLGWTPQQAADTRWALADSRPKSK